MRTARQRRALWRACLPAALATIAFAGAAAADELPGTTAWARSSQARGLAGSSLPLLIRSSPTDAVTVSRRLVATVCSAGCASAPTTAATPQGAVRVSSEHWTLEVDADGTSARYVDSAVEARARSMGRDPAQRMPADALERAGRSVIASTLGSVVTAGSGEEIVPIATYYRSEGGHDFKTGQDTTVVVANRIVFGRTIGGVPVVGGGSTIVLTFANDGSVESFRYDWPTYRATASLRAVVGAGEVLRRVQRVIGARTGVSALAVSVAVPTPSHAQPVAPVGGVSLESLECGYYDPVSVRRDASAAVQAGCVYRAVARVDGATRSGLAGAVPVAAQVEPDAAWPEARILRGESQIR